MRNHHVTNVLLVTLLMATSPVQSAGQNDDWEFSLAPLFLWGMGVEGTSSIGPITSPVNIQFKDALENLDGMFTIHFEAQKRDLALFAEYQYLNLAPEAQLSSGAKVNVSFKLTMAELGAGYRVAGTGRTDVELLGGTRYVKHDQNVTGIPIPPLSSKESWWDVFVGGRVTSQLC